MKLNSIWLKLVGLVLGCALIGGLVYYALVPRGLIVDFSYKRDAQQVLKIFYDDWDWLFPGPKSDYSPEYILKYRSPGDEPYYRKYTGKLQIRVLRVDGRVAGFTTFYKKNFYQGTIQFIAVSQDFRRKGYGQMLTEYAIQQLFNMGCHKVSLVTRTYNKRARSLYTKIGFHMDVEDDGDKFTHFSITRAAFKKAQDEKDKSVIASSQAVPQSP